MNERDASASLAGSEASRKLGFSVTSQEMSWIDRESKARGVDRSVLVREVFARGMGAPSSNGSGAAVPPSGGGSSSSVEAGSPPPAVDGGAAAPAASAAVGTAADAAVDSVPDLAAARLPSAPSASVVRDRVTAALPLGRAVTVAEVRAVGAPPPAVGAVEAGAAASGGADPGAVSSDVAAEAEPFGRSDVKTAAASALATLVPGGASAGLPVVGRLGGPGAVVPGRGLVVLVPDEQGQFSPVTVSSDLFASAPRSVFASFFSAPRAFRWAVTVLVALLLLFGAAYASMAVVASRYEFREVAVSPGRSTYYKVDRWTGRMTRCRTDMGAVGPVC